MNTSSCNCYGFQIEQPGGVLEVHLSAHHLVTRLVALYPSDELKPLIRGNEELLAIQQVLLNEKLLLKRARNSDPHWAFSCSFLKSSAA